LTQTQAFIHAPTAPSADKAAIKLLILDLLEQDTGEDYSVLRTQVEVDITLDTALDSLRLINIVLDLETALGISISNQELTTTRVRSLERFADFLQAKIAAAQQGE
jgi:acyl carrier protein